MKTQEELLKIKETLDLTNKRVYTVVVPLSDEDDCEEATIFLKKVDRTILSALNKLINGADSLVAVEFYLKNTYLGGDDIKLVLGNFDALRACESTIVEMIHVKKATLKKN